MFCQETTVKAIEDAFKDFTTKEDIAIVLISQYVSLFPPNFDIICSPSPVEDVSGQRIDKTSYFILNV